MNKEQCLTASQYWLPNTFHDVNKQINSQTDFWPYLTKFLNSQCYKNVNIKYYQSLLNHSMICELSLVYMPELFWVTFVISVTGPMALLLGVPTVMNFLWCTCLCYHEWLLLFKNKTYLDLIGNHCPTTENDIGYA